MAEEEKKEEKASEAPPSKGGRKKMIIIGAIVFLLIAISLPVGYLVLHKEKKVEEAGSEVAKLGEWDDMKEGHGEEEELLDGEEPLGPLYPFDTFLVNLTGGGYIKMQMQVEFDARDIPKKFYARQTPLRDSIIALLASKTRSDLEGKKGYDSLKDGLREIINETLKQEVIKKVYFTQFVVQ